MGLFERTPGERRRSTASSRASPTTWSARSRCWCIALDGYVDAGSGVQLAVRELLKALPHEPVAEFDVDQLVDYRARRPTLTFVTNAFTDYDDPRWSCTGYATSRARRSCC